MKALARYLVYNRFSKNVEQIGICTLYSQRKGILLKRKLPFKSLAYSSNGMRWGSERQKKKKKTLNSFISSFWLFKVNSNLAPFSPCEDWKPLQIDRTEDARPLALWALIYHSLQPQTSARRVLWGCDRKTSPLYSADSAASQISMGTQYKVAECDSRGWLPIQPLGWDPGGDRGTECHPRIS